MYKYIILNRISESEFQILCKGDINDVFFTQDELILIHLDLEKNESLNNYKEDCDLIYTYDKKLSEESCIKFSNHFKTKKLKYYSLCNISFSTLLKWFDEDSLIFKNISSKYFNCKGYKNALRKYMKKEDREILIEHIITLAKEIYKELGAFNYSERVFQNALEYEFRANNIFYETEKIYTVKYKGVDIGFNRCDLIVEKCIVVELKTVSKVLFKETDKEVVQLKRYLKDLELENGVVINFPPASCSDDISYYIKL